MRVRVCVFNSDLAVHVFSCSQCPSQAWWRFNPMPLYTYTWLVVVVISSEDILPSSLCWSGPGHWGVKSKEKEKRFGISILWKPYCLQNKLIATVYLCLAPLLWKKGMVVICFIVLHIVALQECLTFGSSMAHAGSLSKRGGGKNNGKKRMNEWKVCEAGVLAALFTTTNLVAPANETNVLYVPMAM